MTWISGIQRVLDYIEENLDGEIDIESLAKLAESGTYHLQRSFSLLTGITLTEYIRQRRLTLAASDLLRGMRGNRYRHKIRIRFSRWFCPRFCQISWCPAARSPGSCGAVKRVLASARKPDAERWNYDGVQN